MARLEIKSIGKTFGAVRPADGVSLTVESGEIVAVFGPSGGGKTVLLRMIAGMFEPDEGDILVGGRSIVGAAPERRGIGMAFQNFALFPHMTARDNIASGLRAKAGSGEAAARVQAISRLLKIEHVLGHRPRELSNGQKQRTALARALIGNPRVLLLDDPLRNVDAKLRYEMRLELPSLLKASGSTVLYVTQDYKEAMALGDRIAVLLDGAFAQVATPAQIYREPATLGVARLFGDPTINIVPIEPRLDEGQPVFKLGGVSLALPASYSHVVGRSCALGLRPESILLEETASARSFPAEIVAITPLNEKSVLL